MQAVLIPLCWLVVLFLATFTLLPTVRAPHGFLRGGDFPRQQFLIATLLLAPVILMIALPLKWLALTLLAGVALTQLFHIGRYLPIWHVQSRGMDSDASDPDATLTLLAANVKKSNRAYDRLLNLVDDTAPDILIALEVDDDWVDALQPLYAQYPHRHARPLDNGYGMAVLSRFPMLDGTFRELVVEGVPSLRTTVEMPNGDHFRLYVVHPEPPVPSHDTKGRDAELGKIGFEAAEDPLPVIVSGDLNDVAWSSATQRFQQISRLLDPRVGRGFYNTFSARNPLMRWPLDQLFHDPRFRFVQMRRLADIGSDHFPMLFELVLTPEPDAQAMPDAATPAEEGEVRDMIAEERKRDREAIGSDWEDE